MANAEQSDVRDGRAVDVDFDGMKPVVEQYSCGDERQSPCCDRKAGEDVIDPKIALCGNACCFHKMRTCFNRYYLAVG